MFQFMILISFFQFTHLSAQEINIHWNDDFRKEISIMCPEDHAFCSNLCGSDNTCILEEGFCRNCIGTGLKVYRFISELGKTIKPKIEINQSEEVIPFLKNGNFATLTSRDVYNVIDSFDSLAVIRKFESLCPEESLSQIVFFELAPLTRDIRRPHFVYCELIEKVSFLGLSSSPDIEDKNFFQNKRPPH
jgi:hypothetical protein